MSSTTELRPKWPMMARRSNARALRKQSFMRQARRSNGLALRARRAGADASRPGRVARCSWSSGALDLLGLARLDLPVGVLDAPLSSAGWRARLPGSLGRARARAGRGPGASGRDRAPTGALMRGHARWETRFGTFLTQFMRTLFSHCLQFQTSDQPFSIS